MDRKYIAGILAGMALAATVAVIIGDDTQAAPYNAPATWQADQAFVSSICVDRQRLADGGIQDTLRSYITVPKVMTLADAGSETTSAVFEGVCGLTGAAKTALDTFADGAALVCGRASNRLER